MNRLEIFTILDEAYDYAKDSISKGEVATYIPELGKADPHNFGVSILSKSGNRYNKGDVDVRFTIQSISKIISLGIALEKFGRDEVFSKVGMEPSGEAFNSLIDLDMNSNKPKNPMINSGAITITSMLLDHVSFDEILDFIRRICMDPEIKLNEDVFKSEMSTISRNRSIAYLLESKGIIESDVERTLELYTKLCSLDVTAENLATLGLVLAMDGINPITEEVFFKPSVTHVIKTIMLTCGMYDGSGEFAIFVGIPTKSGVAGGLVSSVDKLMGIGIYNPALDEKGNTIVGRPLLEYISRKFDLHIFARHNF